MILSLLTWVHIIADVITAYFHGNNAKVLFRRYKGLIMLSPKKLDTTNHEGIIEYNQKLVMVGAIVAGKKFTVNDIRYVLGLTKSDIGGMPKDLDDASIALYTHSMDLMMQNYLVSFYEYPERSRVFIDLLRDVYYRIGINPSLSVIAKYHDRRFQSILCKKQKSTLEKACESRETFTTKKLSSD